MGINLQILGISAIPRLADQYGLEDLTRKSSSFRLMPQNFQKAFEDSGRIIPLLFKKFGITWWDVYSNSDIGIERIALAQEMLIDGDDTIIDIGCGRAYFTIAATKLSSKVVGIDLMDGVGRNDWWKEFRTSMHELNLHKRVVGVKADATRLSFKDSSFDIAATVHAIRNFPNKDSIARAIQEMKRIVVKGGRVILVESLPLARNKAQEAHLQMFRCKVKYTFGELDFMPEEEVVGMFQSVGFNDLEVKELDYNLSTAPPLFCIDPYLPKLPKSQREEAQKAYEEAAKMIKKWGDASPPAIFMKAIK